MAKEELENAFLEAAAIAQKLPENLQEAAFNRALDQLLGDSSPQQPSNQRQPKKAPSRSTSEPDAKDGNRIDALLRSIDRTAYPDIGATARTADRALKVLQLVHNDHGIDGLTAAEIATILNQKFRLPANTKAVNIALQRETSTVDVCPRSDGSKVYRIMAPGDDYLERLRTGGDAGAAPKAAARKKASRKKVASSKTTGQEASPKTTADVPKQSSRKKTGGRPGPKAAVAQLAEAGYFKSPRRITEIQQELKHHRGHSYTVQELSPALVRCLRDGMLKRERNGDGQYEYTAA